MHAVLAGLRFAKVSLPAAIISVAVALGCALCVELPTDNVFWAAVRIAAVIAAAAAAFAAGTWFISAIRRYCPPSARRAELPRGRVFAGLIARSLFVVVFGAALALICGGVAVLAQSLVLPHFGLGAAMAAIRTFAAAAMLFATPVPAMLAAGYALSRCGGWHPLREIASVRHLYVPLLIAALILGLMGYGVHVLCELIPVSVAGVAVFAAAGAAIGTLWLLGVAALTLFPEEVRAVGVRIQERLPRMTKRGAHRAQQGVACALAVLLVFGMVTPDALAYAVEVGSEAAAIEPASAEETTAAPAPDPEAKAPEAYYDPEVPEGDLVYADVDMAVYQTGERGYTTVFGGVASTYIDETGRAHEIDNTLAANRASFFSGDIDYKNRANSFEATLPDTVTEARPIRLEKDGHFIELLPEGGDFSRSCAEGEAIRYTDVREGIDYQYTLLGSTVKEDIILTRQVAPQGLSTRITLSEGLTASLEKGAVVVRDANYNPGELVESAGRGIFGDIGAESEKEGDGPVTAPDAEGSPKATAEEAVGDPDDGIVFTIAAPAVIDAAGQMSDNVSLSLENGMGEGSLTVTIDPDWDWICAPERAYPVRIDPTVNIAPSSVRVSCVEQTSPNTVTGENNYAYAGFDDGIATGTGVSKPGGHYICRTYAAINYNFGYIMSEAKINSATFSLGQVSDYSGGATNLGLYRVTGWWDFDSITWNSQTGLGHEFVQYRYANWSPGYINWDVREVVNNWVQGVYPQYGFCVIAENEYYMQCERFANRNMDMPPRLTINWEIPDPVDESYSLDSTTVELRVVTEHDADNKLQFDGVFADGMATPRAWLAYELAGKEDETGLAYASRSYKYPDSTEWEKYVPNGTKYKDKLSNWQTHLFTGLEHDKEYKVKATPTLNGKAGKTAESDRFLIYKASSKDTLPYIASHYGVTLDTLSRDNRVQDTLVVGGNTLFVRNPTTTEAYAPKELTTDQKKRIDSALMGRGKHCEYGFEPINLNTGNFVMLLDDATLPDIEEDFTLSRTYNAKNDGMDSPFGRNWSFAYAESLGVAEGGNIVYSAGDGKTLIFEHDGLGNYTAPAGFDLELVRIPYKKSELEGGADGSEGEGSEGADADSGNAGSDPDDDGSDQGSDDEEEEEPTLYRYELRSSDGSYTCFDCWGMLTELHSVRGLVTTVSYDEAGRMSSITSPAGHTYALTLNAQGHIAEVALPDGNTLSYAYDERGNLIAYTDASGAQTTYTYDDESRMTAWHDANGNRIVANVYDEWDRVISQTDAAGNTSTLEYTPGCTTTTDAAGNVTVYRYDELCRTTSVTYPDGYEATYTYDSDNNLVSDDNGTYTYDVHGNMTSSTTDGHTTAYAYDDKSRLVQTVEPDGTVYAFSYDDAGNLVRAESNAGDSTAFAYDDLGRCVSVADADGVAYTFGWSGGSMTSMTDGLGNTTTFAYDAMGRCVSVTDALGNTSRTIYDAVGHIVGEQDATGAYTAYMLDAVGLLMSVTDPRGYVTAFTYDAAYNIASMTDALGNVTAYEYDALGNMTAEVGPAGARQEYAYDSRSRLVSTTDAEGGTAIYAYDGRSRVISATNPLGGTEAFAYEGARQDPSIYVDALGNTTLFSYDARGNLTRTEYADGAVETVRYGLGGRLASTTDAIGLATSYAYTAAGRLASIDSGGRLYSLVYDEAGRMVSATDPLGRTTEFAYDAAGRGVSVTNAAGAATQMSYDAAGRQTGITDALGNTTTYVYDEVGNLASVTDALGNATSYAYDALSRLVGTTDAAGAVISVTYDAAGDAVASADALGNVRSAVYDGAHRVVGYTDAAGAKTEYGYDAAGNVVRSISPTGAEELYSYDVAGNLVRTEDARGYVVTYTYDARGNVAEAAANDGARGRYSYDAYGNVTAASDALGHTSRYTYDIWGELTRAIDATGAGTSYAYDGAGQLSRATDATGASASFSYDAAGNLASRSIGGITERMAYDAAGNLTSYADGNGHRMTYEYDAAGRAVAARNALGQSVSAVYDAVGNMTSVADEKGNKTLYEYDAAGNLTEQTSRVGLAALFTYDAEGRLTGVTTPSGASVSYARDVLGNVTEVTDALGRKTEYAYDPLGALTSIQSPSGTKESFTYDIAGRMSSATDAAGDTVNYAYDAAGNLASKTYSADASQSVGYTYDGEGRKAARSDMAGSATFKRDGLGRVVEETDGFGRILAYSYDDRGNLSSVVYPDSSSVSYGYDRADNLISVATPEGEYRYAYDATDRPVSLERPNGTAAYWSYDAAGNVTHVENTDAGGEAISSYAYAYDAEGRIVSEGATVADAAGIEHSVYRTFSYDADGRLVSSSAEGTDASYTERYSYDAAGNRVRLVRTGSDPDTVSYTYDADDRLTRSVSEADGATDYIYGAAGKLISRTGSEGDMSYEYGVEGRLEAVSSGGRALMAALYDGDGDRIMQVTPYHEYVEGTEGGEDADGDRNMGKGAYEGGGQLWQGSLFWYGFAAGGAAVLASANPAAVARTVEGACALIEDTWPDGAFDAAAADFALSHLGFAASDLAAKTNSYGIEGTPDSVFDLLDAVTYTNSSVFDDVSQVAYTHSTRSGASTETYGLSHLSKAEGGAVSSYAYDGRGSVTQTLSAYGGVSSWRTYGVGGVQDAGSAQGELPSYGYNAEEAHPQTGLQYLRARYYDAGTGRFGVKDSYLGDLTDPLSLNRYLY